MVAMRVLGATGMGQSTASGCEHLPNQTETSA